MPGWELTHRVPSWPSSTRAAQQQALAGVLAGGLRREGTGRRRAVAHRGGMPGPVSMIDTVTWSSVTVGRYRPDAVADAGSGRRGCTGAVSCIRSGLTRSGDGGSLPCSPSTTAQALGPDRLARQARAAAAAATPTAAAGDGLEQLLHVHARGGLPPCSRARSWSCPRSVPRGRRISASAPPRVCRRAGPARCPTGSVLADLDRPSVLHRGRSRRDAVPAPRVRRPVSHRRNVGVQGGDIHDVAVSRHLLQGRAGPRGTQEPAPGGRPEPPVPVYLQAGRPPRAICPGAVALQPEPPRRVRNVLQTRGGSASVSRAWVGMRAAGPSRSVRSG